MAAYALSLLGTIEKKAVAEKKKHYVEIHPQEDIFLQGLLNVRTLTMQ